MCLHVLLTAYFTYSEVVNESVFDLTEHCQWKVHISRTTVHYCGTTIELQTTQTHNT